MDNSLLSFLSGAWGLFLALFFLGASIFIHELGHFLAARRRGLRIDRFSIGFGPRLFGWTKDGVDYRISLIPFGGYVALPQLADMGRIEGDSEDKEKLPPISYSDKMIVAVMGAVFNVIFAFALATLLWFVGVPASEQEQSNVIGHVPKTLQPFDGPAMDAPAYLAGLQEGDRILAIDGQRVRNFRDITQVLLTGSGRESDPEGRNAWQRFMARLEGETPTRLNPKAVFTIERDGDIQDIDVFPAMVPINRYTNDFIRQVGILPSHSLVIHEVSPNSPAQHAGLQPGDQILEADGRKIHSLNQLISHLNEQGGQPCQLTIKRDDETITLVIVPQLIPQTKPFLVLRNPLLPADRTTLVPFFDMQDDVGNPTQADTPATSIRVLGTTEDSLFSESGFRDGDRVLRVNSQPAVSLAAIEAALKPGAPINSFEVQRGEQTRTILVDLPIAVSLTPSKLQPRIGFQIADTSVITHPNPLQQIRDVVTMTISTLGSLINPQSDISVRHLMGPVGIVRTFHFFSTEDLRRAIWFAVLLNVNLAILNLLPIPVLDGGHMLFATLAKLRKRPLPINLVASVQGTFMILLLSLMLYIVFFDSRRWYADVQMERYYEQQEAYVLPAEFRKPE
jgi:RIP metalloprotease RseP